jgi:hypothetical protein
MDYLNRGGSKLNAEFWAMWLNRERISTLLYPINVSFHESCVSFYKQSALHLGTTYWIGMTRAVLFVI